MAILISGNHKIRLPTPKSAQPLVPAARRAKGFVELLARSNFSFLQGASHPEEMIQEAIYHEYDGISLSDLNGLYGVVRGFQAANNPSLFTASSKAKEGFHYSFGSELTLVDETSVVLIPLNKQGYSNLCELLTLGKRQATKGFSKLSLDNIENLSEGLMCFSLPPWNIERHEKLEAIFKDRLYLPLWKDFTWESQQFYRDGLELEKSHQAQLFATQRPFMHSKEKKPIFDVLTCILHKTSLEKATNKLIQNGERHLKSLDEISKLWSERLDLVEKTVDISRRVNFQLDEIRYRYPHSHLPNNKTPSEHLRDLALKGAQWRYPAGVPSKIIETIHYELNLIQEMEYEDYFLTLKEICEFADSRDILYQGRGSAANSAVCYCLGLTSVDPNQIDVLFERFISKERHEPPDIDIDFEHSRREEVIQHIYEKYDENHAAMVCTVIRYRSRMAIRETAKVFEVPLATINKMVTYMGRDGIRRLLEPGAEKRFDIDESRWQMILQLTQQLHGFPRHLGIHTGGFLITHDRMTEMVPVEKATKNGRYVIQWNKDDVATLKLMKIDVLSLGMLTCLKKCFDLLKNHKGLSFNLAQIPHDDPATYEMIGKADTVGVFQIESRAQIQTLPRMLPKNFYDLVIEVALIRPGPLQGGMVHPYLKRRQGKEKVTYAHPLLEHILGKTHGVPIFQEQVMRIVIALANFTPGESDELRRVMSSAWRKKVTMVGVRERIIDGFQKNNISLEYAEQIYKTIEGFSNYGFPESHAASFALLTYASCYLKQHHHDVFTCALLNSQPMGFYAPRTLIAEAQRHGVTFLPLCIQESSYDYTLQGIGTPQQTLDIRVGLRSLYGVPESLLRRIEEVRKAQGPFLDLPDFIRRTELPRSILIKIAASGALQCFSENARELIWHLESLSLDQESFLWGLPKEQFEDLEDDSENIPFESPWEELVREYDTKGFSVLHHPLSVLRPSLQQKSESYTKQRFVPYYCSSDLARMKSKTAVRIGGLLSVTQRPPTAKGMCFLTLEDEHGFMNIVITPDIYQKYRTTIYGRSLLEIQGHIERVGNIVNIRAVKVLPL